MEMTKRAVIELLEIVNERKAPTSSFPDHHHDVFCDGFDAGRDKAGEDIYLFFSKILEDIK